MGFAKCWTVVGKVVEVIIGFSLGLLFSYIFYAFILCEAGFVDDYVILILFTKCLFLAFGLAFSTQIRCLYALCVPEFCGYSGRRCLQAAILILIIAGPIENIGENGEETLRFISCLKNLTLEIGEAGKDLLLAPLQHIISKIKKEEPESKHNLSELVKAIEPIVEEVEDEREAKDLMSQNDETDKELGNEKRSNYIEQTYQVQPQASKGERIQLKYMKKLAYRCEGIFTQGTLKCKEVFATKYDDCYEAVTDAMGWLLCWPLKLDFVCDILGNFGQEKTCDLSKVIDPNFGSNYIMAKTGLSEFRAKFSVKIDYSQLTQWVNLDDVRTAKDKSLHAFKNARHLVTFWMEILKKVLTLTFFLVMFNSMSYHEKYLTDISFDNNYITRYFKKIDMRRKSLEKSYLFPLKSFERTELRGNLWNPWLEKKERKKFILQFSFVFIQIFVVGTIFGLDYVFGQLLLLVRKHGDFTMEQHGTHSLNFRIQGKGFLADLLRNLVKDINMQKHIQLHHLTKPCLPKVSFLNKSYYTRTFTLFGIMMIISYGETFALRFKHVIANFFYPKRSKRRILWLYNQCMKKRKGQVRHLKNKALENGERMLREIDVNHIMAFGETFPRAFGWLKVFKWGRRKCVLCFRSGVTFNCPNCQFCYCEDCFQDLSARCLYCVARAEFELRLEANPDDNQLV